MPFTASLIAKRASWTVQQRGRRYLSNVEITETKPGRIDAFVFGSEQYNTSILKNTKGEYIDQCDCPYGVTCKHTIALAYVIEKDEDLLSLLEGNKPATATQQLIRSLSKIDVAYQKDENFSPIQHQHTENPTLYYRFVIQRGYGSYDTQVLALEIGKVTQHTKTGHIIFKKSRSLSDLVIGEGHLSPLDTQIVRLLSYSLQKSRHYLYDNNPYIQIHDDIMEDLFTLLAQAPYVLWDDNTPLIVLHQRGELAVTCIQKDDNYTWNIDITYQTISIPLKKEGIMLFNHKPILMKYENALYRLQDSLRLNSLQATLALGDFPTAALNDARVINTLLDVTKKVPLKLPTPWIEEATVATPTPLLRINRNSSFYWDIELIMKYGENQFPAGSVTPLLFNTEQNKLNKRDVAAEQKILVHARTLFNTGQMPVTLAYGDRDIFYRTILPALPPEWQVAFNDETAPIKRSAAKFDFEQTSGINWLDIDGSVTIDDDTLALSDVLDQVFDDQPILSIRGNSYVLSTADRKKLLLLRPYYDSKKKKVAVSRLHVGALTDLGTLIDTTKLHKTWIQTLNAIQSFQTLEKAPLPHKFHAELRPYQQEGVNWLAFLKKYQFGGILADDMGLGKTLQALTLLAHAHEDKTVKKPSLIVAPTSVVSNWESEIHRFTPGLTPYLYIGKERTFPHNKDSNIIVTSYALLRRDHELFKKHQFHYCVLDEAHYIKNHKSQTAQVAYQIVADHRLSLTGTPLENNLTELWSQCAFVNPGLFQNLDHFKQTFVTPIEKQQDGEAKLRLQRLIKPFLLRRLKKNVLKDLPAKTEQIIWCEMDEKQRSLYSTMKQYYQAKILKIVDEKGIKKSQIEILEALLRLRQICCHPDLLKLGQRAHFSFLPKKFQSVHFSAKIEAVLELVETAVAEGHKVLLFSQFVTMLNILQTELKKIKITTVILTGKTKNRQEIIDRFQNDSSCSVFLLSLKAGGTGLNLTAADYVIHYDPWWNPAVEAQATDRAHRIGQFKPVSVYKMLIKDSIEEKIQALQEKKKGLIEDIIGGVSHGKGLTKEDLKYLLE